jgi:hypothetical protein
MTANMTSKSPMSINQAARWAERQDAVLRTSHDGRPDYLAAAVDVNTNLVLCMGFGDMAYDYARAHRSERAIRVYAIVEVLEGLSEEEGEAACVPGARDAETPWY